MTTAIRHEARATPRPAPPPSRTPAPSSGTFTLSEPCRDETGTDFGAVLRSSMHLTASHRTTVPDLLNGYARAADTSAPRLGGLRRGLAPTPSQPTRSRTLAVDATPPRCDDNALHERERHRRSSTGRPSATDLLTDLNPRGRGRAGGPGPPLSAIPETATQGAPRDRQAPDEDEGRQGPPLARRADAARGGAPVAGVLGRELHGRKREPGNVFAAGTLSHTNSKAGQVVLDASYLRPGISKNGR